jgi:uncharacterized membrane protein YedE/YeeE
MMRALASLICGYVFGWGLFISGMMRPDKVLGFLDVLEEKNRWPTQTAIDRSLVAGSILFGVGWGLVGLCPGPAIANLATLSTPVIGFIVAMALGTLAHDLWYARGAAGVAFPLLRLR